MLHNIKRVASVLVLVLISQFTFAATSPITMLQGVANGMISGLKKNQSRLKNNPNIARKLVKRYLVPKVDLTRMSSSVVGRPWRGASASQRKLFENKFLSVLVSTYSSAISSYDGDVVRFYPIRGGYAKKQSLQVRSLIQRRNGQNISVDYYVARAGNQWKVYDFTIENVSIVQSYRSQYADTLAQGGIKLLLQRMSRRS